MFGLPLDIPSAAADIKPLASTSLKTSNNQLLSDQSGLFSLDIVNFSELNSDLTELDLQALPVLEDVLQQAEDGNLLPLLSLLAESPEIKQLPSNSLIAQQLSLRPDVSKVLTQLQNALKQFQETGKLQQDDADLSLLQTIERPVLKEVLSRDINQLTARLDQLLQQNDSIKLVVADKHTTLSAINTETNNHHLLSSFNTTQPNAAISSTQATTRIIMPVQDASWSTQFAERVTMLVGQQQHAARIKINPPELGPIEIKINIQQDQASVHMLSQHQVVREALEDSMPRLKELLQQQGITLDDFNIASDSSEQRQAETTLSEWQDQIAEDTSEEVTTSPVILNENLLVNAYV